MVFYLLPETLFYKVFPVFNFSSVTLLLELPLALLLALLFRNATLLMLKRLLVILYFNYGIIAEIALNVNYVEAKSRISACEWAPHLPPIYTSVIILPTRLSSFY